MVKDVDKSAWAYRTNTIKVFYDLDLLIGHPLAVHYHKLLSLHYAKFVYIKPRTPKTTFVHPFAKFTRRQG